MSMYVPDSRLSPVLELFNFRVTISQQSRFGGFLKATDYPLALTSVSRVKW